ncbi:unnamed protein product [Fraxinus pennsylvanica]|uniref:RNA helicase n=1 Tax=Fraxinus pennsylvanica TaxID=56036 RepID=A0AAD1ZRM8_9LAMI|nr:unnamed protein product [Fraxinus pennsylvanica]
MEYTDWDAFVDVRLSSETDPMLRNESSSTMDVLLEFNFQTIKRWLDDRCILTREDNEPAISRFTLVNFTAAYDELKQLLVEELKTYGMSDRYMKEQLADEGIHLGRAIDESLLQSGRIRGDRPVVPASLEAIVSLPKKKDEKERKRERERDRDVERRNREKEHKAREHARLEKLAKLERGAGFSGKISLVDSHWLEKKLEEMTERDWRIFREDFSIYYEGSKIPRPVRSWIENKLSPQLLKAVERAGYKNPSPIQMAAIPLGLQQRDLIGVSETGSGKTAAFLLPMLIYITCLPPMTGENRAEGPYAVVMAPTRELAKQIENLLESSLSKLRTRPQCLQNIWASTLFLLLVGNPLKSNALELGVGVTL